MKHIPIGKPNIDQSREESNLSAKVVYRGGRQILTQLFQAFFKLTL